MIRYIYCITNLINGKNYIGQRKLPEKDTSPLTDCYFGSGKLLNYAIQKYGKENFKKEYIWQGECSQAEINELEKYYISNYRLGNKAEYNLADGGTGGKTQEIYSEERKEKQRISNKEAALKLYAEKGTKHISIALKEAFEKGKLNHKGSNNGAYGKHWKMPKGHQQKEQNNQFGKHWWTNGKDNIFAKECPENFYKGRFIEKSLSKRDLEKISTQEKRKELLLKKLELIKNSDKKFGWKAKIARELGVSPAAITQFLKGITYEKF